MLYLYIKEDSRQGPQVSLIQSWLTHMNRHTYTYLNQLNGLVRHLGQLSIDGDILPDGPLRGLSHLLVADLPELCCHLVHPQDHFLLQPGDLKNDHVN